MIKITYSAPAKVILTGEHAVVYGKPALVSALDLRMSVTASQGKETDAKFREIIHAVKKYLTEKNMVSYKGGCTLAAFSSIPAGRGLGSSAALSVASSAAVGELVAGAPLSIEDVNNCAYRVEKLFHANPSGVDTSASCLGGLVFFRKEFEFLKTVSSLNAKIPRSIAQRLLLIDTGKPEESTSEMVQKVGKLYNTDKKLADSSFSAIERITKRMVVALMKEDGDFFSQCIRDNGEELEKIGVVSVSAKKLLNRLAPYGSGKVTGAGGWKKGSGFVLFYSPRKKDLEEYLEKEDISYLPFEPAAHGYRKIL